MSQKGGGVTERKVSRRCQFAGTRATAVLVIDHSKNQMADQATGLAIRCVWIAALAGRMPINT